MLPTTINELDRIKKECESMVTKRASVSAVAAAVPLPGVDIAGDVAIMIELIPAINRKYGLTPEQIEQLDPMVKLQTLAIIKSLGSQLIGKTVSKVLVTNTLKKVATRFAVKSVTKFIPIIGQATSAGISFAAMKYLGNSHIKECHEVCLQVLKNQQQNPSDQDNTDTI